MMKAGDIYHLLLRVVRVVAPVVRVRLREPQRQQRISTIKFQIASKIYFYCVV